MKQQQTITLWNVTIPQARKLIEIIKSELQQSIIDNDFETASDLLYQIKDIESKIELKAMMDESEGENDD